MRRVRVVREAPLLWLLLVALGGCATIAPKTPVVSDAPVRSAEAEVLRKGGAHATLQQEGTILKLAASRSCDVIARPTVLRTTRTEYENRSATTDWVMAGSGLALVAAGILATIDAPNVGSSDKTSQTYNPLGPTGATVIGIGSIGIGTGLIAVPIVDVFRAQKVEVGKQEVTSNGAALRKAVPCSNEPHAHAAVTAKTPTETFALGETGDGGQLNVDLDAAINRGWVVPNAAQTATVFVAESEVGTINLASLYKARESHAYPTDAVPGCATPSTSRGCESISEFLRKYPSGDHSAESRRLLEQAAPKLRRLADAETWHGLNVEECIGKQESDPAAINAACAKVRAYLSQFPDGEHVKEGDAAVKKGTARAEALEAELERKRRAAEAAERRQALAEEQAELRRENARKAQDRSDCSRIIQAQCARSRIPYDICVRRLMEARGQCKSD